MNELAELSRLGHRLKKADLRILAALRYRMNLALQVGTCKMTAGKKIFHAGRERERLATYRKWATKHRMNPHFVEAIFYLIMGESLKLQTIQLQRQRKKVACLKRAKMRSRK